MKTSKLLSMLTACTLLTALPSCAQESDTTSDGKTKDTRKALYSAYAAVPEDLFYIPIYSKPDTESGGVVAVYLNDELEILSETADWAEVKCRGYTGYIQKEYLSNELLPEVERPTRPATTSAEEKVTTETSTDESESESTVTTTEKDGDKDMDKDKDKDSEEETTTEAAPAEEEAA